MSEDLSKTKQEVTCKVVRTMLNYARLHRGPDCEARIADAVGLHLTYLHNENNWVSFEVYKIACEFMIREFSDPKVMYKVGLFAFSNMDNFGAIAKFVVYLSTPEKIFKRAAAVANEVSRIGNYRLVEFGPNRMLLEFINHPNYPFHQFNCDYRLGLFAGVPQLFGLPIAKHRSVECVSDGHARCLYEFRWQPQAYYLFGKQAVTGMGMGLAFAFVLSALNRFDFSSASFSGVLFSCTVILYLVGVIMDIKHSAQYKIFSESGTSDDIEETMQFANEKYEEALDTVTKLKAIIEANSVLQSKWLSSELVDMVLEIIRNNLGYDRAMILHYDEKENSLMHPKVVGKTSVIQQAALKTLRFDLQDDSFANVKVFKSGEPILIEDISKIENFKNREFLRISGTKSLVILPFRVGEKIIGTLTVDKITSPRPMNGEDVRILMTLLNVLSVALENAELYLEMEERVKERTSQLNSTNHKLGEAYDELKATQVKLLHSEKMASIGKLVAGIAHEMNNPAGILLGNVELMEINIVRLKKESEALPADAKEAFKTILKSVDEIFEFIAPMKRAMARLKNIVVDLRNFSSLDEVDCMPADLNQGLQSTLKFFQGRTDNRIQVITGWGELPPVVCYPGHLNQAFSNIVSNAIDAVTGSKNPKIDIHTSLESTHADLLGPHVKITISDNGVGINKDILDKIFDPFFTTKEVGSGTGLGLSIAYGVIQQHDGHIVAESEEGRGTTMIIRIPLEVKK